MIMQLRSKITCPDCGYKKVQDMPTNPCQFFYRCENCKTVFETKQDDCVYYSL